MKSPVYPIVAMFVFLSVVGLACGLAAPTLTPTQASEPPKMPAPTQESQAPEQPLPTTASEPATNPAELPTFFVDEFDGTIDISNYTYFEYHGEDEGYSLDVINERLVFDISDKGRWVYITYDPYIYTDVGIQVVAENRGNNKNNVTLMCRYDDARNEWYEFNVANNGLYDIFAHVNGTYFSLFNGGSTAIKMGRDTNTYTIGCVGNVLSLYINGKEARTITEKKYNLREGLVGFSVSSFDIVPILVEIDSFEVFEP